MKLKIKFVIFYLLFSMMILFVIASETGSKNLKYFGEKVPGDIPIVFAPGVVSTNADETSIFFSPDMNEIYFIRSHKKLLVIKKDKTSGKWKKPEEVSFGGKNINIGEANISPDGKRIYFNRRKSVPGAKTALTLWFAERTGERWGKARGMKPPVNNQVMHAVAISADGSIYASGLRLSKKENNRYHNPVRLKIKGSHPFIPKSGEYLLYSGKQPKGYGGDLYILFKNEIGKWTVPRRLSAPVNSRVGETNPAVSPDGKYLFFTRKNDIYWVRADFLKNN